MSFFAKITFLSFLMSPVALAQQDLLALSGTGAAWSMESATGLETSLGPCGFDEIKDVSRFQSDQAIGVGLDSMGAEVLFRIDTDTGRGTLLVKLSLPSTSGPANGLATDDADTVYLHTREGYWYVMDLTTGKFIRQGKSAAFDVESMTYHDGLLWIWDTRRGLLTLDPTSTEYARELVLGQSGVRDISAIHFLPTGELRGAGRGYWEIDSRMADFNLLTSTTMPDISGLCDRDAGGPPPGPVYQISNLVSGQVATLSIAQAQPNAAIIFAWSFSGAGPTPTPFGDAALSVPISQLPPFAATAQGEVVLPILIPPVMSGIPIWTQAAELYSGGGGVLSNPLAMTVQ